MTDFYVQEMNIKANETCETAINTSQTDVNQTSIPLHSYFQSNKILANLDQSLI
jgi:hypothetical protein